MLHPVIYNRLKAIGARLYLLTPLYITLLGYWRGYKSVPAHDKHEAYGRQYATRPTIFIKGSEYEAYWMEGYRAGLYMKHLKKNLERIMRYGKTPITNPFIQSRRTSRIKRKENGIDRSLADIPQTAFRSEDERRFIARKQHILERIHGPRIFKSRHITNAILKEKEKQ